MSATPPRTVVPATTRREALIAVVAGVLVLGFVTYGILQMAKPAPGNDLTGVVVGKEFTPQKERQVSFSGNKISKVREIDGEYVLKVRVPPGNRVYDVPVEKEVYETKREGDPLTFLRPESEQR